MRHVLSTHLLVQHRLTTVWLERIRAAGIPEVEIFCAKQHLDWYDKTQVNELAWWFRDSDLKLHSLHAPLYTDDVWGRSGPHSVITLTETAKPRRVAMVDEIKRALEIAEKIPFRYLVQHVGAGGEEYDEKKLDAAFACLEELSIFAASRGVEILLENIPNRLASAERLLYFLEVTHLNTGFCFDTGHAHLMEGLEAAWSLLAPRVKSTHVHDNDGESDLHLFPLLGKGGTIDWARAMKLFRGHGEDLPLLLELRETPDYPHPVDAAKEVFARLEKL
jgi:sugar phosphate isomerase/epimerase